MIDVRRILWTPHVPVTVGGWMNSGMKSGIVSRVRGT